MRHDTDGIFQPVPDQQQRHTAANPDHAFFVFRDRNSGEQYSINDAGIFLSEKAAKMLGVRAGDSVRLQRDAADFREVRIGEVTENYIFHYALS